MTTAPPPLVWPHAWQPTDECQICGHDLTEHRHCICYSQQSNGDFCWCHEDKSAHRTPETETTP